MYFLLYCTVLYCIVLYCIASYLLCCIILFKFIYNHCMVYYDMILHDIILHHIVYCIIYITLHYNSINSTLYIGCSDSWSKVCNTLPIKRTGNGFWEACWPTSGSSSCGWGLSQKKFLRRAPRMLTVQENHNFSSKCLGKMDPFCHCISVSFFSFINFFFILAVQFLCRLRCFTLSLAVFSMIRLCVVSHGY